MAPLLRVDGQGQGERLRDRIVYKADKVAYDQITTYRRDQILQTGVSPRDYSRTDWRTAFDPEDDSPVTEGVKFRKKFGPRTPGLVPDQGRSQARPPECGRRPRPHPQPDSRTAGPRLLTGSPSEPGTALPRIPGGRAEQSLREEESPGPPGKRIGPAVTLLLLSPVIAELLFGVTTVTTIFVLDPDRHLGLCGPPRPRAGQMLGKGWLAILLLGIAVAIAEECLIQQTSLAPLVGVPPDQALWQGARRELGLFPLGPGLPERVDRGPAHPACGVIFRSGGMSRG